jgi:ABC-type transporter Mla MlaB component
MTRPDTAAQHWHVVGHELRPLHEQLAALSDTSVWTAVAGPVSSDAPLTAGAARFLPGVSIGFTMNDAGYGCLVVSGDIDERAVTRVGNCLRALLESSARWIVADLSAVGRGGSRLGPLLSWTQRRLWTREGALLLANVPPRLRAELTIGRLPEALFACNDDRWPPLTAAQAQNAGAG